MAGSPSDFDACREWLGIDRADLEDPLRILGLAPGDTDPLRVLRAAELRLTHLKGLAAGPHHAAREALILRVEQARETVLSRLASGPPRAAAPFAMPPPPRGPAPRAVEPEARLVGPGLAVEPAPAPAAEPAAPLVRVRPTRPLRRRGTAGLWLSAVTMLASVAVFMAFIWWQTERAKGRGAPRGGETVAERDRDAEAGAEPRRAAMPERPRRESSRQPLPEDAAISTSPPPPSRSRTPPPYRLASAAPRRADRARMADAGDEDPTMGTAPAEEPAPEMPADDAPMAGDSADDEPAADGPPAEDPGDADAASAVDGAVSEALAAIRTADFDGAEATLATALAAAEVIPAKRRVSDWQTLAHYAREYDGFRTQALDAVRAGQEYDVNGKKLAIVEVDATKMVYRYQGRNRTSERGTIPAGIVLAIVTEWFDDRPANNLFLGAWHATKPEPDLERARGHFEAAEAGGINAEPLLRLLDDPLLAADSAAEGDGGDGG
ncbi:MAG: hypothetical protein ACKO3G_04855 [Planctomycetaceae bacterium]